MPTRRFWVYILASRTQVVYVGKTTDLLRRVFEHRSGAVPGFTRRYGVNRLVHFEETTSARSTIARERQLKGWVRRRKVALIESENPGWKDLSENWY